MLRRLSVAEFIGALIDHVENATGIGCFDCPDDVMSPLFSIQVTGTEPADTKTMFMDRFDVWMHCISKPVEPYSNAPVLELARTLEEAMTEDVAMDPPFVVQRQEYRGMQALKRDESGEGHAVLSFRFYISYGYRIK